PTRPTSKRVERRVDYSAILATIAGVYLLAAISPGPNFFMISRASRAGRRDEALLIALGIAVGSTIWVVLTMLGVAALLAQLDWRRSVLRVAGAIYLAWFGVKLVMEAFGDPEEARAAASAGALRSLRTGLITSLTNPKAGAFWTSIFASMFPTEAPLW